MKIGCRSAPILAGIFLILVSAASQTRADENAIRAYSATTFAELTQTLGKEFMREHQDARVKFFGKTSEAGFQALLNGQADLVLASREPTVVERSLAERKSMQWKGARVAGEDVAVISHPGVAVTELTVDQLRKIYTGEYKNWRELGGADLPILPHSMAYPQDELAVWFFDTVLSKADFGPGIIWVSVPDFLVQHVSVHPGAVAYLGNFQLADALKRQPQWKVQVLNVRAKAESRPFSPSAVISKKEDYPLIIPLFLFWNENNPNKWAGQFAGFCTERLQELVGR
jgi:phosphate transport system substrate-binding protein